MGHDLVPGRHQAGDGKTERDRKERLDGCGRHATSADSSFGADGVSIGAARRIVKEPISLPGKSCTTAIRSD